MAKLVWDQDTERLYETGVSNCALYVHDGTTYGTGVAWNGITTITESPSGAEATDLYADNTKYLTLRSAEQLGGTIEAYMYPDEWADCDGSKKVGGMKVGQQPRSTFALAYITKVGNDVKGDAYGEKLHVIYGATASPSERSYATINDSPEAITFSWEYSTVPIDVNVTGIANKASMVTIDSQDHIDSTTHEPNAKYKLVKESLFGRDANQTESITELTPTLLTPSEIYNILTSA